MPESRANSSLGKSTGEARKKNGQLVEVDADEMLRKIAPGSDLDTQLSLRVLGNLISELAGSANAGVVAYGEMVDLLWQRGQPETAIRLEETWNELLKRHPFRLLCGYAARMFGAEDHALLDHVCSEHSLCVPSAAYLASGERARLQQVFVLEQRARELEAALERGRAAAEDLTRFNRAAVGRE